MAVDRSGLLDRLEKDRGDALDCLSAHCERAGPGNLQLADVSLMLVQKGRDLLVAGALADHVTHIHGEEIAAVDEAIHRRQIDVVRIHAVGPRPAELLHGRVCLLAQRHRFRAHDLVLAIRLVPHRSDVDARLLRLDDGHQLCLALVQKPVAQAHAVLLESHIVIAP